jgi:DNA-directed RNA polymerase delta subunit
MVKQKKTETDVAVEILVERNEPVYFKDLLEQVAARMGKDAKTSTLVSIYSRINLDNRLVYQGDGYWYFDTKRIKGKE